MAHYNKVKKIGLYSQDFTKLIRSVNVDDVVPGPTGVVGASLEHAPREEESDTPTSVAFVKEKDAARCLTCGVVFMTREEQVSHYQLDWHRYNLKRRLKGLSSLEQDQFERIADDLSSISGSGSDSEETTDGHKNNTEVSSDDDDCDYDEKSNHVLPPTGSPFLQFSLKNDSDVVYSLYHKVLSHSHSPITGTSLYRALSDFLKPQVWIILMRSGGHFAGAVYRRSELLAHKTFHRYTVRAKRGMSQSVRDGQQGGSQPKSAGASLRRYNEAALASEIQALLVSWSSFVQEATSIFLHTPKHSRGIFVGERGVFVKGDERVKSIPFQTRRPTLSEVHTTFDKLSSLYMRRCSLDNGETVTKKRDSRDVTSKGPDHSKDKLPLDEETAERHDICRGEAETEEMLEKEHCGEEVEEEEAAGGGEGVVSKKRRKKKKKLSEKQELPPKVLLPPFIDDLLSIATGSSPSSADQALQVLTGAGLRQCTSRENPGSSTSSEEEPLKVLNAMWNGNTVLHVAAEHAHTSLIPILMEHGADPAIKNDEGHTPYLVSKSKATRDMFRRFMAAHPSLWDYVAAQIPSPLTEEMERDRSRKEAEKRKERKKKKATELQERKRLAKKEDEEREALQGQQKVLGSLSQRERRALAAEKRMAAQLPASSATLSAGVCSRCGCSLLGVVPFARLDYKYCSMNCLKQHRAALTQN